MSGENSRNGQKPSQTKPPRVTNLPPSLTGVSDEAKRDGLSKLADPIAPPALLDADIPPAVTVDESDKSLRTDGRTWKNKNPRVICYFQVRMPEPLKEKLAVVARLTPRTTKAVSEHSIVLEAIERDLDRRLRTLGYKP